MGQVWAQGEKGPRKTVDLLAPSSSPATEPAEAFFSRTQQVQEKKNVYI